MVTLEKDEIQLFELNRDELEMVLLEISRFTEPMSKRMIEFLYNKYGGSYWYVIDTTGNGKIDAYLAAGEYEKNILHIFTIAVRDEFEGKGLAKKLLVNLMLKAKQDKFKKIKLEARIDNFRAINLYKNLGWVQTDIKLNYYDDGTNAYVMELEL